MTGYWHNGLSRYQAVADVQQQDLLEFSKRFCWLNRQAEFSLSHTSWKGNQNKVLCKATKARCKAGRSVFAVFGKPANRILTRLLRHEQAEVNKMIQTHLLHNIHQRRYTNTPFYEIKQFFNSARIQGNGCIGSLRAIT